MLYLCVFLFSYCITTYNYKLNRKISTNIVEFTAWKNLPTSFTKFLK